MALLSSAPCGGFDLQRAVGAGRAFGLCGPTKMLTRASFLLEVTDDLDGFQRKEVHRTNPPSPDSCLRRPNGNNRALRLSR